MLVSRRPREISRRSVVAARLWLDQGAGSVYSFRRKKSLFSNGRTSTHYNPKGKIYVYFVGNAYKCVYMCFHAGRRGDEPKGMTG